MKMKTTLLKKLLVVGSAAMMANLAACDRTNEGDYSSTTAPATNNVEQSHQANTTKTEDKLASAEDKIRESADSVKASTENAVTKAGNAMSDSVITGKVKAALLADKDIKGTDIKVETNQGIVTLNGTVNSRAQIDKAESLTRAVEGVQTIDNRLNIKG